jgi:hypothetical protein
MPDVLEAATRGVFLSPTVFRLAVYTRNRVMAVV